MARLEYSTEIHAPASTIFDLMDEHANYHYFMHGFAKLEWTTERHQVGTILKLEERVARVDIPLEMETTEIEPGRRIAGQFISGVDGQWEWTLEPMGEVTIATMVVDYDLPYGVLGQMADRMVIERDLKHNIEETMEGLRQLAEEKASAKRR